MVSTLAVLLSLASPKYRGFKSVLAPPEEFRLIYGCRYFDGRLWITDGWTASIANGKKVFGEWEMGGQSIAPSGDYCWLARARGEDRIHLLSPKPGPAFDASRYESHPPPSHPFGSDQKTFNLGAEPFVCRCRDTKDVIALAGRRLWLLRASGCLRIGPNQFSTKASTMVDAISPGLVAACDNNATAGHLGVSVLTDRSVQRFAVPGELPFAIVRATRDTVFLLTWSGDSTKPNVLYRIDLRANTVRPIAKIGTDYMATLAWNERTHVLYANYADAQKRSRIECLTPEGKVLWRSKTFEEPVTGISVAQGTSEVYATIKGGLIYVLTG